MLGKTDPKIAAMTLEERRQCAWNTRGEHDHYGNCHRCGVTWDLVRGRSVMFSPNTGMFPICTLCFKEATLEEKIYYYKGKFEWNKLNNTYLPISVERSESHYSEKNWAYVEAQLAANKYISWKEFCADL